MNLYEADILKAIHTIGSAGQRELAQAAGCSLGKVNRSIAELMQEGFLDENRELTAQAKQLIHAARPKNALILAAGYGLRMIPLNFEVPKGLLEVNGEALIDRTIRQLHEAGIYEITVVVGYQKEKYEYLMDQPGIELIVNMEYAVKNNLTSLAKAAHRLGNTYIIPCDLYSRTNPYSEVELYDWYMISDRPSEKSTVRINRRRELMPVPEGRSGSSMLGICYLTEKTGIMLRKTLLRLAADPAHNGDFWDDALFAIPGISVYGREVRHEDVTEIDTFEQLRALDGSSGQLKTEAIRIIAQTFGASIDEITNITTLKKGMTNRSFLFSCRGTRYIMRIPGEGTDLLINRREEAAVYDALAGLDICDDVIYMNPENGYKITRFLEGCRVCDPENETDLILCMRKLRDFHEKKLWVSHTFDIFGQIGYYRSLWGDPKSIYRDYEKTEAQVLSLKAYIDAQEKEFCLTHIDAVPDNFLLCGGDSAAGVSDPESDLSGTASDFSGIRLIDWEYAGMQDPHVDIAMFCIYALYDKKQVDHLIDLYFEGRCPKAVRAKIYCYIAACGLLWSNWCEYKSRLGVEFGEYALRQYRYAKDYYTYAAKEMES